MENSGAYRIYGLAPGRTYSMLRRKTDMPYIDRDITGKIVNGYEKHSIAYDSGGFCQPLFAISSMDLYEPLKEYHRAGGESMSNFRFLHNHILFLGDQDM